MQTFVAAFFISGYVVFSRNLANMWAKTFRERAHRQLWINTALAGFNLAMVGFCLLAAYLLPANSGAYMNWALYLLFVSLIEEQLLPSERLLRGAFLVAFWGYSARTYAPVFWLSLAALACVILICVRWPQLVRHSRLLTLTIALWTASAYWLSQTQLQDLTIASYIVMFMVMVAFTLYYWTNERRTERERLHLVDQVKSDALTGAGSFLAFRGDAALGFDRAASTATAFSLLMFDIDHFKSVNDDYGHFAGNEVLVEMVRRVSGCLAASPCHATLYRTGGEEFDIIVTDAEPQSLMTLGNQILAAIATRPFTYEGQAIRLTLSMGITGIQPEDLSFEDVYKRADANLYTAKENGRAQIVCSA